MLFQKVGRFLQNGATFSSDKIEKGISWLLLDKRKKNLSRETLPPSLIYKQDLGKERGVVLQAAASCSPGEKVSEESGWCKLARDVFLPDTQHYSNDSRYD